MLKAIATVLKHDLGLPGGMLDRLHGSKSLGVACRGMMFLSNFKVNKRKGMKRSKGLWRGNPLWQWGET